LSVDLMEERRERSTGEGRPTTYSSDAIGRAIAQRRPSDELSALVRVRLR
jgi:hypothetical protein